MKKPELVPGSNGVITTLNNCFGYYNAKDDKGELVGPLVGYAGTYKVIEGGVEVEKHYVGHKFFNFAQAEQWPFVLDSWAEYLMKIYFRSLLIDVSAFLAAPMGGLAFAQALARAHGDARYIYAEKEVTEAKTATAREKSALVMGRHEILSGDRVIEVEDVTNNFSTTEKIIDLVEEKKATIDIIVTVLNRSSKSHFITKNGRKIRVLSVAKVPTHQYRQDDPIVAEQVAKNNVIWKPKDVWMPEIMPLIIEARARG